MSCVDKVKKCFIGLFYHVLFKPYIPLHTDESFQVCLLSIAMSMANVTLYTLVQTFQTFIASNNRTKYPTLNLSHSLRISL